MASRKKAAESAPPVKAETPEPIAAAPAVEPAAPSPAEETAEPTGLALLGDEHRRAWRMWRARGGDGSWRTIVESGFVPFARSLRLDVPNDLNENAESIDQWAADVLGREADRQ